MRKSYVALVAAGLLLTIGSSAEAGGRSGSVTPSFAPPGLRTTNPGFNTNSPSMKDTNITAAPSGSSSSGYGPSGWSQGKADPWKGITPTSSPPGLK